MKKNELMNLVNALKGIWRENTNNKVISAKFWYGIKKNLDKLQETVNIIFMDVQKISMAGNPEEFNPREQEFQNRRQELLIKLSKKDEKGEPILINNGRQYDLENQELFMEQYKVLEEEYKDVIEEYQRRESEIQKIMNEDIDVELYKINIEYLPNEGLTPEQINSIYPLIEE